MHNLGFSVRVFGLADLPSADVRPSYRGPDLSVSLVYLRDVFEYLHANDIHMYRIHSRLLPLPRHPELSDVSSAIRSSRALLARLGILARDYDLRLSVHADSAVTLNAPYADIVSRSRVYLAGYASLFDAMGVDGCIVVHIGGVYDDSESALARFSERVASLSPDIRKRLAVENDDRRFGIGSLRRVHAATGLPIVFDNLHHLVLNPEGTCELDALRLSLRSWPKSSRPKVHFCTPRCDLKAGSWRTKAPTWTEHSDFCNPFSFIDFMRQVGHVRDFDIMLEARARDLALLKLRLDIARFAPDLVGEVH